MQRILEQHGVKLLGRLPRHRYKRGQTGVGNSTRVVQETGDPHIRAQDRGT